MNGLTDLLDSLARIKRLSEQLIRIEQGSDELKGSWEAMNRLVQKHEEDYERKRPGQI
jgi:hypothetical protein